MTTVTVLASSWHVRGDGAELWVLERLDRERGVSAFAAIPAFYEAATA